MSQKLFWKERGTSLLFLLPFHQSKTNPRCSRIENFSLSLMNSTFRSPRTIHQKVAIKELSRKIKIRRRSWLLSRKTLGSVLMQMRLIGTGGWRRPTTRRDSEWDGRGGWGERRIAPRTLTHTHTPPHVRSLEVLACDTMLQTEHVALDICHLLVPQEENNLRWSGTGGLVL